MPDLVQDIDFSRKNEVHVVSQLSTTIDVLIRRGYIDCQMTVYLKKSRRVCPKKHRDFGEELLVEKPGQIMPDESR